MNPSFKPLSPQTLATLVQYDSPTISNVIELFRVRPNTAGWMSSNIRAMYPQLPPVVGYATTATFRSASPSVEKDGPMRIIEHVEKMQAIPEPRVCVIQDLDEPPSGAVVGEVMCRLYRRFGCAGIITNGKSRDLLQVEKLRIHVFSSGLVVSHSYPHFLESHVAVQVGGLTVRPGSLLHADANGVVEIPHAIADLVAAACADFCDAESIIMNYLESANVTLKKYGEVHAQTARAIANLGEKLRAKLPK